MSLLYMDIWELEPITKKMDRALLSFYQSKDYSELQIVAAGLDELAPRHICFELLRLDWLERLDMVDSTAPKDFQDLLPHKKISHLCSSIDTMQKQIKGLIAQALDMDREKRSVSEKMVAYYNAEESDTLNTFQFQPQSMNFEVIDHRIFAEVLYPKDIYDLIDFQVRECVKRKVKISAINSLVVYWSKPPSTSTAYWEGRRKAGRDPRVRGAVIVADMAIGVQAHDSSIILIHARGAPGRGAPLPALRLGQQAVETAGFIKGQRGHLAFTAPVLLGAVEGGEVNLTGDELISATLSQGIRKGTVEVFTERADGKVVGGAKRALDLGGGHQQGASRAVLQHNAGLPMKLDHLAGGHIRNSGFHWSILLDIVLSDTAHLADGDDAEARV